MAKNKKEIKVRLILTEGWEERFAKATYDFYMRVHKKGGQAIE